MTNGADPWDVYWRSARREAVFAEAGPSDPSLDIFWRGVLDGPRGGGRMVDLACGAGAVARRALDAGGWTVFGLDAAPQAISGARAERPELRAVIASAAAIPMADKSFDLVVSQYGVEYAGLQAFSEMARLVAPGGRAAALVHYRDGAIYREVGGRIAEMRAVTETAEFFPAAHGFFETLFAAERPNEGATPDAAAMRAASQRFEAAARVLAPFAAAGPQGLAAHLLGGTRQLYERRRAYDLRDIAGWLSGMEAEVVAFRGRMNAMQAAALDKADAGAVQARFAAAGLDAPAPQPFRMGASPHPAAWVIEGLRPA